MAKWEHWVGSLLFREVEARDKNGRCVCTYMTCQSVKLGGNMEGAGVNEEDWGLSLEALYIYKVGGERRTQDVTNDQEKTLGECGALGPRAERAAERRGVMKVPHATRQRSSVTLTECSRRGKVLIRVVYYLLFGSYKQLLKLLT